MSVLEGASHVLNGEGGRLAVGPAVTWMERAINRHAPNRYLGREEFEEMWTQGLIDDFTLVDGVKNEGFDYSGLNLKDFQIYQPNPKGILTLDDSWINNTHKAFESWMLSQGNRFSAEEIILFYQRQWITNKLAHHFLARLGYSSRELRAMILKQKNEFPTVQDLIHFSVRHGFEPEILQHFGYNKEIPNTYLDWAKKIGLGGDSEVFVPNSTDENGNAVKDHSASWAEQHWFAHWILPSLGDAYEMLHRLYPDSDYGPSPDSTADTSFSPSDLALFQRAQDIPKYWRERLQSISYNPFSRVDVRRMFNSNIITEKEVYHSYRAQGYDDKRSKQLLEFAKYTKRQQIEKEELWPKAEKLCQLYSIGILDSQQVTTYTDKLGIPKDEITDFLNNCNLEAKKKQVEQIIKILKRAFVKGIIDEIEVNRQLTDFGIRSDAITDYVLQWTLEKQFEFKEDNASEAQKWYEQGIITNDEFVNRLQNIGVQPSSILRMVQSTNVIIAERIAKEQAKLAKEIAAKAKEAAKEIKDQAKEKDKEQRDLIKRMLASSTQVNLKAWYKQGLISVEEVSTRLSQLDYSQPDIDRWLTAFKK